MSPFIIKSIRKPPLNTIRSVIALALAVAGALDANIARADTTSTLTCQTMETDCINHGANLAALGANAPNASIYTAGNCQAYLSIAVQNNGNWPALGDGQPSLPCALDSNSN